MVREDGLVKVLDFGLAKLAEKKIEEVNSEAATRAQVRTEAGMILGTVAYMSPEQARGHEVDARTDIFSLGVVLYEMLTGRLPFTGDSTSDVIASILRTEPKSPGNFNQDIPTELNRIVAKTLEKDREERYQTAKDLLVDLKHLNKQIEVQTEIERTARTNTQIDKEPATQLPAARPTSNAGSAASEIKNHKRGFVAVLSVLILAAVGFGYWFFVNRWATATPIESIAVMPFVNGSGNADVEYLSDGISESLINSLSQLSQLKVIARSSTFRYKGKEIDPQEVGNALGVQAIVTGRIEQRGDNLQISVEMVDARDKTQIWGEQYNRKAADLQAVQGEIALTISEKLRVRLTGAQEQRLTKRATENPEAYQLYLNGEFYSRKGRTEDRRKALDYYNQAIARDPNFALAYIGVAGEYVYFGSVGALDPKETQAKAKAAAEKALELNETLSEAHARLGIIKLDEWDWVGAESEFKRALELNPSLASAHGMYSFYLTPVGRHTEALAHIKRAQELDPLTVRVRFSEGVALYNARRYDEAIKQLQTVVELQPDYSFAHEFLGFSYAMKGMYAEAITEYQKFSSLEGETTSDQIFLGYTYAMSGKREKALAILNKLKTTNEYVSPAEFAILYAGLGDKEGAFQLLERAYAAHDLQMQYLKVDPHYDSLRSDPRFTDLMRRVGLTP